MAGTITAGALANIQQAAREAGINDERIVAALESVPYTVTWNDGSLSGSATEFRAAMRDAGVAAGIPEAQMDLFCTRIIALDTGLSGVVTGIIPDLDGVNLNDAWQQLEKAGLRVGTVSLTADQAATYSIGDVIDDQSPAAAANEPPGTAVSFTVQKGMTVPDLNDLTFDGAWDALIAAGLTSGNLTATAATGTVADGTGTITEAGHPFVDGNRVFIVSLTGGTGLTQGQLGYVVNASGDDFGIALKEGDTQETVSTPGTEITCALVAATIVDPDGAAADDAITQDPAAGTFQEPATAVTVTLGGVAVPDWTTGGTGTGGAMTSAEFASALSTAGLIAGTATDNLADAVTAVVSSDPAVGTFVQNGSAVDYTYDAV